MKNKTVWWVVGVVAIIVIAAVVLWGKSPASESGSTASSTGNTVAGSNTSAGQAMSLRDLAAASTPEQCAFSSQNPSSSQTAGTVYVGNGQLRGDFTSHTSAGTVQSHIVTDGKTAYVWTDNTTQGVKMSFASMSSQSGGSNSVNADQKVDYSCAGWAVDQSKFTLPKSVTFTDLSAGIYQPASGTTSDKAAQCAVCDRGASPASRDACRTALGC